MHRRHDHADTDVLLHDFARALGRVIRNLSWLNEQLADSHCEAGASCDAHRLRGALVAAEQLARAEHRYFSLLGVFRLGQEEGVKLRPSFEEDRAAYFSNLRSGTGGEVRVLAEWNAPTDGRVSSETWFALRYVLIALIDNAAIHGCTEDERDVTVHVGVALGHDGWHFSITNRVPDPHRAPTPDRRGLQFARGAVTQVNGKWIRAEVDGEHFCVSFVLPGAA